MSRRPRVIRNIAALRRAVRTYRSAGARLALVPTMGALHEGHLSLVRLARRKAHRVIVSIFVNPTQFAAGEDLASYPRSFDADLAVLAEARADVVWAPTIETMYPEGFASRVVPSGPAAVGLEDAFRPHFFAGVATVVAKLLLQCLPDIAVFGEKDYQQLRVVLQMVRDLDIPVRIVAGQTVREVDGLAMSSRNVYLSPGERALAPSLYRVLTSCAEKIVAGRPIRTVLGEGREALERAGFSLDYLEARHTHTLRPIAAWSEGPVRLLAAVRLGAIRLIDNVPV